MFQMQKKVNNQRTVRYSNLQSDQKSLVRVKSSKKNKNYQQKLTQISHQIHPNQPKSNTSTPAQKIPPKSTSKSEHLPSASSYRPQTKSIHTISRIPSISCVSVRTIIISNILPCVLTFTNYLFTFPTHHNYQFFIQSHKKLY
jgi:hypothetical protein